MDTVRFVLGGLDAYRLKRGPEPLVWVVFRGSLHDCGPLFFVKDELGERDWMRTDAAKKRSSASARNTPVSMSHMGM
jgi:hypothetical protein